MSRPDERLPLFDLADAAMVGWEIGIAEGGPFGGQYVLRARCSGCGEQHALTLPLGARIEHAAPGVVIMTGVSFHGPMRAPAEDPTAPNHDA